MAFIPSGQKNYDSLNGDKLKELKIPKTPKSNTKNIFDKGKIQNPTVTPDSFYMQYSDEVDWIDEECENFDDVISQVNQRFDIKTFRDATGRKPKTQKLFAEVMTESDKDTLKKLYNQEFELESSIDEILGNGGMGCRTRLPGADGLASLNKILNKVYSESMSIIISSIDPKEIFRISTSNNPVKGTIISLEGKLFDDHILQNIDMVVRRHKVDPTGVEYRAEIDEFNINLDKVLRLLGDTLWSIRDAFFDYINFNSIIRTAILSNDKIKAFTDLSCIIDGLIGMSKTDMNKKLKNVNDNIFTISRAICKEFGRRYEPMMFKELVYEKMNYTHNDGLYHNCSNIHRDNIDRIIDNICDLFLDYKNIEVLDYKNLQKLYESPNQSIGNLLISQLTKEHDARLMDYINSENTSDVSHPRGWQ